MPLHYPKAISLNTFNGGYNKKGTFKTIEDDQTNDAQNVEITLGGAIAERSGYRRQLNTALATTSGGTPVLRASASPDVPGDEVLGHFQIVKTVQPVPIRKTIVAAGPNLWDYSSQTATAIGSGFNSGNFWFFSQIQDPRSASDDVIVAVNGTDSPQIWNGVESATIALSAVTSATGVQPAKFILSLKNRIYLLNIADDTDVDSNVKVLISGFDPATGAPRPQRFQDSFFVGGSDKTGEINGGTILHDQVIIFKKNATYKFTPGSGPRLDTAQLVQMDEQIGCIAPGTIAVAGNVCIFLGELGVFAFDGNNFQYISGLIEPELINTNKRFIQRSRGIYYRSKNQYWLSVPDSGSDKPDKILVYDLTKGIWFPPYFGLTTTILSTFSDTKGTQRIAAGDKYGFLHTHDKGFADGVTGSFTGTLLGSVSASGSILTDTCAVFPTSGDGIGGAKVRITGGTGEGKEFTVVQTTSTITMRIAADENATGLDSTSEYVIGGICSFWRSKDFDFGNADTDKKFKKVTVRVTQEGDHNLNMQYIIDFKALSFVPTATLSLLTDGPIFGSAVYGTARFGNTELITRGVSLRAVNAQSLTGKNFSIRFSNDRAFQPWEVQGFDIQLREIGRR